MGLNDGAKSEGEYVPYVSSIESLRLVPLLPLLLLLVVHRVFDEEFLPDLCDDFVVLL